jgi:hypothetical protein
VLQLAHERIKLLAAAGLTREAFEPFAKGCVEGRVLRAGNGACLLDEVRVGTEGDVFHTRTVYTIAVRRSIAIPKPNGGEEAARAWALLAVTEEQAGAAGGAEVADKDVLFAQTGGQELGTVGFAEVEANVFWRRLVTRGHHVEPLEGIGLFAGAGLVEPVGGIGKLRSELSHKLGTNLIAAPADRRTKGGEEIGGVRAEAHLKLADGFLSNARESATPTGVDSGDSAMLGVRDKDGDAVGSLDAEEDPRSVGD